MEFTSNIIIPLIPPKVDDDPDEVTNYFYQVANAIRALALNLDAYTGVLSPKTADWGSQNPTTILGNQHYRFYAKAGSAIAFGDIVNFYNLDATHVQARKAKADSANTVAHGFCLTVGGVAAGSYGEFICGPGIHNGFSGLTPGATYYLSIGTAGAVTTTVPAGVGNIRQIIGVALTDTTLLTGGFNQWIQL